MTNGEKRAKENRRELWIGWGCGAGAGEAKA